MFDANFLANIIVWKWINNTAVHIIVGTGFVLWIAVDLAMQGAFIPLVLVVVVGVSIYLLIRNMFRRQRELQAWREAGLPTDRQDPYFYARPAVPQTGLRAPSADRWPVSR